MAITLSTSKQRIGVNSDTGFRAELYGWYSNQSGNTAVVHVELRVTFIDDRYYDYTGTNKNYSLNFNGNSSDQYSGRMVLDDTITMAERTQTLSGGASISASGSWYSYQYGSFSVSLSDTVVLPAFVVPPTNPSLTITNDNAHQNTITYGTTSWGNPNSGNIKLWVATNPSFTSETLLETKTTTGLHTFVHTGLTADTTYYYRTKATNGSADSSYKTGNVTTRKAVYVPTPNDPEETNETALVQKLLVPFNGLSKNVIKLYRGNADDEAERIY